MESQQQQNQNGQSAGVSRRSLLKNSTVVAGAAMGAGYALLNTTNKAWAQVSEEIKVGVVGCGGRGSGAMGNILEAAQTAGHKVKIHAVADMFQNQADVAATSTSRPPSRPVRTSSSKSPWPPTRPASAA